MSAKSFFRSSSIRNAAFKFASKTKPTTSSSFRIPKPPILRSPAELSFCVESLLPMHSVTASALMTSLLTVTRSGYGWLDEVSCILVCIIVMVGEEYASSMSIS